MLKEFKQYTDNLRKKEKEMESGFELFQIPYDGSQELADVENEIDKLSQVWSIKEEWDNKWDEFQKIQFSKFEMEALEDEADDILIQVKDLKDVKKWEVVVNLKNSLETFKQTLPLIKQLKEPYMRDRHWVSL